MRELRRIEQENKTKMVVFPQCAHIDIEENLSRPVDVRERVRAEGLTEIEPYN